MTGKRTKILFIHHGTGIGGAPISLLNLIKQLDSNKYECKVALVKGGVAESLFIKEGIKTEIIDGSTTYFGHHEKGRIQLQYYYRYPRIIYNWFKTINSTAVQFLSKNKDHDIIHLNSDVLSSWAVAAKKMGFKVVCHNRDPIAKGTFGIRRFVLKKILRNSVDVFISISNDNCKRLGFPKKTKIVYNFISLPNSFRESMVEVNAKKKVLYLGGMAKIKGFDTAVECLPYLNRGIRIQFAGNLGTWKEPSTIKERIKRFVKLTVYRKTYKPLQTVHESDNSEVLGLLKNPLPTIDNCDILITPFKIEHFSRPAVEAFAYGKPVIGSNVEGMDEIIDHGENGLLVEKENPKALADAINYLCEHPEKAREMGLKGRQKAEHVFSPEINTQKVEAIYDRLMENE